MTLSTLWPLCLLPLIGIIIIFYLLKQPTKEKVLSSLTFWQSVYKQQHAEKPWEKFRHNLLMYLQILTVLFLILSLCAPILKNATKEPERLLLVFDTSGSMQTLYSEDGTTRLEQAKKEAETLITSANSHTEITIISCSDQAQILLSNSTDSRKTLSVLEKIEAQDCAGTLNNAISFCSSIYSQWDSGRCIFFTDSSIDTGSLPAQIYDLSTDTDALGNSIVTTNLSAYYSYYSQSDNGLSLYASICNTGNKTVTSDINFYWNDKIVSVESCTIRPGSSAFIETKPLPELDLDSPGHIKVEIQEKDALNADNTCYSIYTPQQENRILLVSRQNSFLENALLTFDREQGNVYKITSIEDYNPKEIYSLYVFDGIYPDILPESGSVMFFPDSNHMKESGNAIKELLSDFSFDGILKNKYLNLRTSSVSEHLQETAFPVAKLFSMEAPADAENIFTLDNGASGGYMKRNNGHLLSVFGFDLHDTDFPLQTEFPILMYNLCEASLTHTDFSSNTENLSVTAGETITFYPSKAGKPVSIRNEDGIEVKSLTPSSSLSANTVLYKSGFYDFYTKSSQDHAYLAVNFSADTEGNILEVPEFTCDSKEQTDIHKTTIAAHGISLQKLLLFLSLMLLITEFIFWSRRQWNWKQRPACLALRTCLILLLCLSLIDIRISFGHGRETTLFLVDVSDSMKKDLSTVETALEHAIKELPSGTKAGIVAFGANSCIEHFISSQVHFSHLETTPVTSATNLENALQTASSMFSSGDSKRIVLLTDGQENEGIARNAASTLKENQISLKVMKFTKDTHEEVLISNVRVPESLTMGEDFQVEVTVISNVNTSATLSLYSGDTLKAAKQVSLTSGTNRFLFNDTLTKSGLTGYRVIIESEKDTESVNNEYLTFTQAEEKQKILLIEGREGEAAEFEKILKAGHIAYEKILPVSAPGKLLNLKKYPVVICENVHADDLPENFKSILTGYVNEGGGLIAIGGDNSFALGNYPESVFDELLPVNSRLLGEKEVPETAMALVIDHSGSMQDGNKRVTRLSLAKEAAMSALTSLRKTDSIGVLEFDDAWNWVVPFTKASDIEQIQRDLSTIQIGGGTSIYPALSEAIKTLSSQSAKLKHIILLTDGQDGFQNYDDLYHEMEEQNITLSTVAVSDGADTSLLESMAEAGQGRYYYADLSTDIPRIFSQEVYLSSNSYMVNKEFTPSIAANSPVMEPLEEDGLFPLYGYIRTTLKYNSSALLVSDTNDPILAVSSYGLGKTAAFTTDVTNEWTKDYAGLDSYASFWKSLIKSCITETDDSDTVLNVSAEDTTAHITYKRLTEDSTTSIVNAICTDEDGNSFTIPLTATSPYCFEADAELEHTGVYSITITEQNPLESDSDKIYTHTKTGAFASEYSREYRLYDDNSTLDDLISLTDAEVITNTDDFYTGTLKSNAASHTLTTFLLLLTLLLFIADIAIRRFGLPDFLRERKFFININRQSQKTEKKGMEVQPSPPSSDVLPSESLKKETHIKNTSKKQKKGKQTPELLDTSKLLTSRKTKK